MQAMIHHLQYGLTPLMMATMNNHVEVANVLLEAGADVNLQSKVSRSMSICGITVEMMLYTHAISYRRIRGQLL